MLRTNLQDRGVVWESLRLNHSLLSQDWEKAEWPHWMLNSIIWDTVTQILIMFTDHTLCHRIIIRHTLLSTHIQAIQVACGIIEHFAIIETILPKFDATLIIISSICIFAYIWDPNQFQIELQQVFMVHLKLLDQLTNRYLNEESYKTWLYIAWKLKCSWEIFISWRRWRRERKPTKRV
mgnify:CR=1 FL=1